MPEKIILASPRGFCAGVERAIDVVEKALEAHGAPVYVKHQIVHNTHVVDSLAKKGAIFTDSLAEVPEGSLVIFSAHGSPPKDYEEAAARRLKVIDATCPLVTKVHLEARRYAKEGYSIILVGHKGHVEVVGTSGEAPEATRLVGSVEDAMRVEVPDPGKVVCLTQTTLSVDDTKRIIGVLTGRFPMIKLPPKEDICYATQNRQNAVKEVARGAEVVLVVGSKNSSNSNRMVEVAEAAGARAYLIDDYKEINPEWLKDAKVVGLTAGASAPEYLVAKVAERLKELGAQATSEIKTADETVKFVLPKI